MEVELFVYSSHALKDFPKDDPHEGGSRIPGICQMRKRWKQDC
jgi:hypothetical protein